MGHLFHRFLNQDGGFLFGFIKKNGYAHYLDFLQESTPSAATPLLTARVSDTNQLSFFYSILHEKMIPFLQVIPQFVFAKFTIGRKYHVFIQCHETIRGYLWSVLNGGRSQPGRRANIQF
jgi:hypothetical protein